MSKRQHKIAKLFETIDIPIASAVMCEVILILGLICEKTYESNAETVIQEVVTVLYLAVFLTFFFMTMLVVLNSKKRFKDGDDEKKSNTADRMRTESTHRRTMTCLWVLVVITMVIRLFI